MLKEQVYASKLSNCTQTHIHSQVLQEHGPPAPALGPGAYLPRQRLWRSAVENPAVPSGPP